MDTEQMHPDRLARNHRNGVAPIPVRVGPDGRHLVDTTVFFTPTSGGVRRYLLSKHRWLTEHSRLRHTILVPGAADGGLPFDLMTFASPPLPFAGGYRCPIRLRDFRERLAALEPDLLESGDPYQLAHETVRVARERGIPCVAFCHSDLPRIARGLGGSWSEGAAARYLARLYRRFDSVLAPSEYMVARLRAMGVPHARLQPLGVDVQTFHPGAADPQLRRVLGLPADARLLVFAGRCSPEKHVGVLIEAVARLGRGHHLLLVGGGAPRRLADNVTVLEYQRSPAQLARVLASADLFVHAGDRETFGLVVLEAMACGLPVVAAAAGALPELVDDEVGACFPAHSPLALARAVTRTLERDPALLRRAARARAEKHGWDPVFTRLLGRYLQWLGAAPSRAHAS
jgi:alpha-1,6-mannosyltransferase